MGCAATLNGGPAARIAASSLDSDYGSKDRETSSRLQRPPMGAALSRDPQKNPQRRRNAVHLSGAALRSTGNRVFDIFTVLGLEGLGR